MLNDPLPELPALPSLDAVRDEVERLQLPADPSELHGALSGFLAGNGELGRKAWLRPVLLYEGADGISSGGALDRLYVATCAQMADPGFGFGLLLPDEAAPVQARTAALLLWCRGFLGGFGLAAGDRPPPGEAAREALADLSRLAAADPGFAGDDSDEVALTEISEFVRVAALLVHDDCRQDGPSPGPSS